RRRVLRKRRRHEQIIHAEVRLLVEVRDLERDAAAVLPSVDGRDRDLAGLARWRPRIDGGELDEGAAEERAALARLGYLCDLELDGAEGGRELDLARRQAEPLALALSLAAAGRERRDVDAPLAHHGAQRARRHDAVLRRARPDDDVAP